MPTEGTVWIKAVGVDVIYDGWVPARGIYVQFEIPSGSVLQREPNPYLRRVTHVSKKIAENAERFDRRALLGLNLATPVYQLGLHNLSATGN